MARIEKIVMALAVVEVFLSAYALIFSAKLVTPVVVLLAVIMYLLFTNAYLVTRMPESRMNKWFQGSAKMRHPLRGPVKGK